MLPAVPILIASSGLGFPSIIRVQVNIIGPRQEAQTAIPHDKARISSALPRGDKTINHADFFSRQKPERLLQ